MDSMGSEAALPSDDASATTSVLADGSGHAPEQVSGMRTVIDVSHATPGVVAKLGKYFRDKSRRDPMATMGHFCQSICYIDATLGSSMPDWEQVLGIFHEIMPNWPEGAASYPVRIIGDDSGVIVIFVDTPGLFGPKELRIFGVVDLRDGDIVRWIDYWDGRHPGIANRDALKLADEQCVTHFRESEIGVAAAPIMQEVVTGLAEAFRTADFDAAAGFFAPDGVFEDYPSHLMIHGSESIGAFFANAGTLLPFIGEDIRVRHMVGGALGGGYEWTNFTLFPTGVSAIELDPWGKITRLSSMWDGARVGAEVLHGLAAAAVKE
jgi:limonene-1,2-epoxide hydrolase